MVAPEQHFMMTLKKSEISNYIVPDQQSGDWVHWMGLRVFLLIGDSKVNNIDSYLVVSCKVIHPEILTAVEMFFMEQDTVGLIIV